MKQIQYIDAPEKWTEDYPYHPDDVTSAYLSVDLVNQLLSKIQLSSKKCEEILNFIKLHEDTHRQVLLGLMNPNEALGRINEAAEHYRSIHHRWIHLEPEYNLFYRLVNRGNWR